MGRLFGHLRRWNNKCGGTWGRNRGQSGTASPGCHDALERMVEPEATTLAGTLKLFVCGYAARQCFSDQPEEITHVKLQLGVGLIYRLIPGLTLMDNDTEGFSGDRFIAVMESIHEVGVRYCDIRVDNLMLTEAGDPAIVDLDRARFNPIAIKEWEMDILKGALRGETHDFSMRSPGPYKGIPSLKSESFTGGGDSGGESDSNGDGENGEGFKRLEKKD
ncbi:hypothetical protein B0H14DRAFT_2634394 [Mycena olivaceomarginata]|nr:hypothetical protein B0H14DRAFT_2634394 [Mycena olivaceomarginata]